MCLDGKLILKMEKQGSVHAGDDGMQQNSIKYIEGDLHCCMPSFLNLLDECFLVAFPFLMKNPFFTGFELSRGHLVANS